jgi:hypothetical protein
MPVSWKLTMPDLALLAEQLGTVDERVLSAWGDDAETLLAIEVFNVTQRTLERANDTGALASSVTGQAYAGAKNETLIAVWFNNAQQYAQWGRYYAPYQEGPPIGLSTYTNAPRHLLFDAQTDDASQIAQWAATAGQPVFDNNMGV